MRSDARTGARRAGPASIQDPGRGPQMDGWIGRRCEAAGGGRPLPPLLCIKGPGNARGGVGEVKRENLINVIGASPRRVEIKLN